MTVSVQVCLLESRRGQSVGIMLSQFKCSIEAIGRAIEHMDARVLTCEQVQGLRAYLPTEEEAAILSVSLIPSSDQTLFMQVPLCLVCLDAPSPSIMLFRHASHLVLQVCAASDFPGLCFILVLFACLALFVFIAVFAYLDLFCW